jgi:hypothetical protein
MLRKGTTTKEVAFHAAANAVPFPMNGKGEGMILKVRKKVFISLVEGAPFWHNPLAA